MSLRVVLYCPDRHLVYDGRTPEAVGVGGGVTARVRMARALARLGHEVTQVVNCPQRETIDGVEYVPLDEVGRIQADVVVFNTSGGALDLTPAERLSLSARLRIVWVQGTTAPGGLQSLRFDVIYAPSNFIHDVAVRRWGVHRTKVAVTFNGYEPGVFQSGDSSLEARDPYRLVYFSHPSKGLVTACAVLEQLRLADDRFHLEVAGGERLWGGEEGVRRLPPGASYHGLLGQSDLIQLLLRSSYSLQMQAREEPGALAIHEAARAGCVIVASPVGCYVEQICDGVNGVVVPEPHYTEEAWGTAARRILAIHTAPDERERIAQAARAWALDTDTLAQAWTQDWLARMGEASPEPARCGFCGGNAWRLADGDHCSECGLFTRRLAAAVAA